MLVFFCINWYYNNIMEVLCAELWPIKVRKSAYQ